MTTAPEGRGGYRAPSNPAPISGPGALSQRTDGGPTQGAKYVSGLPYGQGQETFSNQVAAPMAGNPFTAMDMPTELMAPTSRPNEPITSGIDIGEGPGSTSRRLPNQEPNILTIMQRLAENDPSGDSELIYNALLQRGI
jgi:hypothetical protein